MLLGIVAVILNILIIFYVIFSLSHIKHQLDLITNHLNIKEEDTEEMSNEEIEKILEDQHSND